MSAFSLRAMRSVVLSAAMVSSGAAVGAQTATSRIVSAANHFLATLDAQKRNSVLYSFDDDQQRATWSNFPTSFVPRGGISLKDMSPAERAAAMALVASALSAKGFEKVQQIMEGDEVQKSTDNQRPGPGNNGNGRPPGQPPGQPPGPPPGAPSGPPNGGAMFGKDLYYIALLGKPSEKDPWMLQFGGHHIALNITISGERGVLTPTLTGAQPARYTRNGKTVRPLGLESDKALALLNALDQNHKKKAILNFMVADLVLGPGQDGKTIQPEGLKASSMTERQQEMLLGVIAEWAGIIHESAAAARMAELKADINETWFAWSGPTTGAPGQNITAYYRIQGPHLVIEYAPQSLGGDLSLHVHTMYRDPTNDYGRRFGAK